jgi:hypothetical protein
MAPQAAADVVYLRLSYGVCMELHLRQYLDVLAVIVSGRLKAPYYNVNIPRMTKDRAAVPPKPASS